MRVQVCDISCLRKDPRRSFQRLDLFFHKIMLLLMMMMTTMMMIMHKVVGTGIGVHQNNFQYIRSENVPPECQVLFGSLSLSNR